MIGSFQPKQIIINIWRTTINRIPTQSSDFCCCFCDEKFHLNSKWIDHLKSMHKVPTSNVHTLDYTTAYLNSPMTEEFCMRQMPIYEISNQARHLCRLNKWSYGLPASGFEWYQTLKNKLIKLGFRQSKLDHFKDFNKH